MPAYDQDPSIIPESSVSSFWALQQRVTGIEANLREMKVDLTAQISNVAKHVETLNLTIVEKAKPQWGTIVALATLVVLTGGALWGMAIRPVSTDIDRIYATQEKLREDVVPRRETNERNLVVDQRVTKMESDMIGRIDGLKNDINSRLSALQAQLNGGRR